MGLLFLQEKKMRRRYRTVATNRQKGKSGMHFFPLLDARMPVYVTCDGALLEQTLTGDDVVVFTWKQSSAHHYPFMRKVRRDCAYFVHDVLGADRVVGAIHGVCGNMTTLWHLAYNTRPETAAYDREVRDPIRRQLQQDAMLEYRTTSRASAHGTYCIDGNRVYTPREWAIVWGQEYAARLHDMDMFRELADIVRLTPDRRVFIHCYKNKMNAQWRGFIQPKLTLLVRGHAVKTTVLWGVYLAMILNGTLIICG